jgi:hypothetical protein
MTATVTRKRAKAQDEDLEQKELPGIESAKNPKIRRLARQYKAAQRERMSQLDVEVELKEKLIEAMKEEGLETYKDKDIIVTRTSKDSIKVKSPSDDEGEDEGDDD